MEMHIKDTEQVRGIGFHRLILCALLVAFGLHLTVALRLSDPLVLYDNYSIGQDFTYHSLIGGAFLRGEIRDPWAFESAQQTIEKIGGIRYSQMMLVGLGPVGMVLYGAYALLTSGSLRGAYLMWFLGSFGVLAVGIVTLMRSMPCRATELSTRGLCLGALLVLLLLSENALEATMLGQSTSLALGALFTVWGGMLSRSVPVPIVVFAVLLLSMKPLYLLPALVLLVSARRWWILTVSLSLLAILWLVMGLAGGFDIVASYVRALIQYGQPLPDRLTLGAPRESSATLAGILMPSIGEGPALMFSSAVASLLSGVILWRALRLQDPQRSLPLITLSLVIGIVLAPYVGNYEGVLLGLPLLLGIALGGMRGSIAFTASLLVLLVQNTPLLGIGSPSLVWALKVVAALAVFIAVYPCSGAPRLATRPSPSPAR
jgi:hypothetical protein